MKPAVVRVPPHLLLSPDLSAVVKLVWAASSHHASKETAVLQAATGLSRPSVLRGLRAMPPLEKGADADPAIPIALLKERQVGAHGKLLYGALQLTPTFNSSKGDATYPQISALTQTCVNTVKRSISELTVTGWLETTQGNRLASIQFQLCDPAFARGQEEVRAAKRRLKREQFKGEALMREYLSLLIDSDQFKDGRGPDFLVNPVTDRLLELDRWYPPDVAFEFQGAQHYGPTDFCTEEESRQQQARDLMKLGSCVKHNITLIYVHAEDLSLAGMQKKVGHRLPLRNLDEHEELIDYLERRSKLHRSNAADQ